MLTVCLVFCAERYSEQWIFVKNILLKITVPRNKRGETKTKIIKLLAIKLKQKRLKCFIELRENAVLNDSCL